MKKYVLLLFILVNISFANAQNLVLGFSNPNEILNLNSGVFAYDTVFLFNNAELNISNNTQFTVNNIIALLGSSKLKVTNSNFQVNKIFSTQDSSVANLSDTISLACNLYVSENSKLIIDNATISIPMTYKSEFGWWAFDNSSFEISNSDIYLASGSLQGSFSDSACFTQYNNTFTSAILPMTFGIGGNSQISIDSCYGGMEFVIAENADVNIQSSELFMIWYTFENGDTANYSYPAANSSAFPLSSNIIGSYQFSNLSPNVKGVDFKVSIQNTDGVFWGILSKKNSDILLNNSFLMACGFYFGGNNADTANGFINNQLYTSFTAPYTDRSFSVNNTTIRAWNFYPSDTIEIVIDSCIYGESLGFGNSVTKVYNSTCDGSGGYFGGNQNSKSYVYSSKIIRSTGSAQILNFQDNAKAWFHNSTVNGDIVISSNTQLFFGNTVFNSNPSVKNNAYFAQAYVDSVNDGYIDSTIIISGIIQDINGTINNSKINRYLIEYSLPDSSGMTSILDSSSSSISIINNELARWNTNELSSADYLLWLTIYVDGNHAIKCCRDIKLLENTDFKEYGTYGKIKIYPNPTNGGIFIEADNIKNISISDCKGVIIYNSSKAKINIEEFYEGMYLVRIETKDKVYVRKLILEK